MIRRKEPSGIAADAMLTGEMGIQIKERALILKTAKGLVVVTGCSHPGIVPMVERAREVGKADIHLVFGGFHLLQQSESDIKKIIARFRELGVDNVGAAHCMGDAAISLFRQAYGPNFINMGVGRIIDLLLPADSNAGRTHDSLRRFCLVPLTP